MNVAYMGLAVLMTAACSVTETPVVAPDADAQDSLEDTTVEHEGDLGAGDVEGDLDPVGDTALGSDFIATDEGTTADAPSTPKVWTTGLYGGKASCTPCDGVKPFCRRQNWTVTHPTPMFGWKVATTTGQFSEIKKYCQDHAPDADEADPATETIQWIESIRGCTPANTPVFRWFGDCSEAIPGKDEPEIYKMIRASVLCCHHDDNHVVTSEILFIRVPKACGYTDHKKQTVDYTSFVADQRCNDWMGLNPPPNSDVWE